MNYVEADNKLQGVCKDRRKVGNNTYLIRDGDDIAVRLHSTNIITYRPNGDVVLDSGGWHTVTTKARMNDYIDGRVSQENGVWWYKGLVFADGMVIHADGTISGQGECDPASNRKLKKRIKTYAELCSNSLPLPMPSSGDCWLCLMGTSEGKTLGDSCKDTSHLDSHMDEGYVVPSLVFNAMIEAGYEPSRNMQFAEVFGQSAFCRDYSKGAVKRSVVKYMQKRFGFAR